MKFTETMLTPAEVTFLLAHLLGPARGWDDLLNDMRQGRAGFPGVADLLPVIKDRPAPGRVPTPLYRLADVVAYVRSIRLQLGCDKPFPFKRRRYTFDIDDSMNPHAGWKFRRGTPALP